MVIYVQSYIINSPTSYINFLQRECCGFLHTISADIRADATTPTFTLTCTSTGGPVTTVSWRRDGEILNDNSNYSISSQVLTDAETATYSHTLRVTGRPFGEYECNVSNRKPSSSSETLVLEGK